jgi:arylsulfatase A-like enzyme
MHNASRFLLPLLAIAVLAGSILAGDKTARPNVVLVMTDDQGYGDLACHGNPILKTPNLDKFYTQSVRLTNFHVDPTCSPTRSALMTGRYSHRVGVWHTIMGRSLLRSSEVTLAEMLAQAGYATGIFGKWHLGDNYPMRPQDQGFQEVFVHGGGGVGQTPDYWGNTYTDDTYFRNGKPEKVQGYCTDVWFDAALSFITKNKDRPFFAYIPTNAAHGPFRVPEKYAAMYKGNPRVPNANFYGMITNIDDNMGRLFAHLHQLGLEENTIVIFMTDNGTAAGFANGRGYNAGLRGTKGSQYDGGHRVPCFIRWPAGKLGGGKDIDGLTAHIDLVPTLTELCGAKVPATVKLDGKSLVPLLKGGDNWPERILVVESQRIEFPQKFRQSAVMTDRWRLIDGKELYDMETDPGQKTNIAAQHPGIVKRLTAHYEQWWLDVSKTDDQYARIGLGSEKENPSRLTCHDWHESNPPWDQSHIGKGMIANGFWAVEIERAGMYEIELRCRPVEEPELLAKGLKIKPATAHVKIQKHDTSMLCKPNEPAVRFVLPLEAGPARLQAWIEDVQGTAVGAYFVYVRRVNAD